MNNKNWYVYIIECKDKRLYTGITDNLDRRIKQHNCGCGCRFTKFRFPVVLKYGELVSSKEIALKREDEIKGWNKSKKESLWSGPSLRSGPP